MGSLATITTMMYALIAVVLVGCTSLTEAANAFAPKRKVGKAVLAKRNFIKPEFSKIAPGCTFPQTKGAPAVTFAQLAKVVNRVGYLCNDPVIHKESRLPAIQATYEVRKKWMKSEFTGAVDFMQMRLWNLKSTKKNGKTVLDHSQGYQAPDYETSGRRVIKNEFPYAFEESCQHFLCWDPNGDMIVEELAEHLRRDPTFLKRSYHVVNEADDRKVYIPSGNFPYDFTKLVRGTDYVIWDNPNGSIPELHHLHIVIDTSKPRVQSQLAQLKQLPHLQKLRIEINASDKPSGFASPVA